jgi:hypothetical protein
MKKSGQPIFANQLTAKKFCLYRSFTAPLTLLLLLNCSPKEFRPRSIQPLVKDKFLSLTFNHFEGGVLFGDVELGMDVLWKASFKDGRTYKENLGFFVSEGLLILPNKNNTAESAQLDALPNYVAGKKLFVLFGDTYLEVLGIIHSHPDVYSLRMPTPRNDYPFSYLGIHNYVMGFLDLLDAYKDPAGNEVFDVLGPRNSYSRIPFAGPKSIPANNSLAIGNADHQGYSDDSTIQGDNLPAISPSRED